jgi:hypothetical protein
MVAARAELPELLGMLAGDRNSEVRRVVASNRYTPLGALETLSKTSSWYLRQGVAGNPAASPEILDRLSRSVMSSVRLVVAGHPACPPVTLQRLLRDRVFSVQALAANHPSTSRATRAMWQLAHSDLLHGQ